MGKENFVSKGVVSREVVDNRGKSTLPAGSLVLKRLRVPDQLHRPETYEQTGAGEPHLV